jgi:hypothetical protein
VGEDYALLFDSLLQLTKMSVFTLVSPDSFALRACVLFAIVLSVFKSVWAFRGVVPKGVPWPGIRSRLLGWQRASLRSMFYAREMVEESYYKVF